MRTISRSGRFKRDYKRLKAGPLGAKLDDLLREALALLAADPPLPERFRDHALAGEWKGYRDCHIRPDLVLIYASRMISISSRSGPSTPRCRFAPVSPS
jgi:mRNA interferase YafQ